MPTARGLTSGRRRRSLVLTKCGCFLAGAAAARCSNSRGGGIKAKTGTLSYNYIYARCLPFPWLLCEVTAAMLRNPPLRVNYYISGIHHAGGPGGGTCNKAVRTAFKDKMHSVKPKTPVLVSRLTAGVNDSLSPTALCRTRFRLLKPCGGMGPGILEYGVSFRI